MARKPRIHYPGAFYHVMLRGNDGQSIFLDDSDRCRFYLLIQEGIAKFKFRVHAFCCMGNHVHIAIQVSDITLSRIMQNLSFRYTRWINLKYNRIGHLFQGRYKSLLVDADSYLLQLVRYIHLNPVRAGLVESPEDFSWSGHKTYIGQNELPWLEVNSVLSQFSQSISEAILCYKQFVEEGKEEGHRKDFHQGIRGIKCGEVFGDDHFVEDVFDHIGKTQPLKIDINMIIEEVCRIYQLEKKELMATGKGRLASEARAITAWVVRELPEKSLTELSQWFKRDISTLSISIERMISRTQTNIELRDRLNKIAIKFKMQ